MIWLDSVEGNVDILVGTRSSLWVPMKNTGLIIVDEEHDSSFYQQSVPFYDGVQVAIRKAELGNIPVILGSATPRVDHYHLTESGRISLLSLTERPVGSFPTIRVIDMKDEKNPIISKQALEEIKRTVSEGKQVFVFVHRKGYSNYVVCYTCGKTITCPHCSVSMTFHRNDNLLKCHYCGHRSAIPKVCPECGSMTLSARGFGTERVEHDLQKFFPSTKIMRMDRETIDNPIAYEKALLEISRKNCQVIVGTKMITKGLDFPDVEMVLIVDADRLMSFPSYDSSETAFQHIAQVSGRSGRASVGKAFIQTFNPNNRIMRAACERDYESFYEGEITLRKKLNNPPFSRIAEIVCYGNSEDESGELAEWVLKEIQESGVSSLEVFGPLAPLLSKLKNSYRMKLVVKMPIDGSYGFLEKIQKKHPADIQIIINGIGGMV
jgi:primosomal protein N' (replication factor Y)